MSSYLRGADDAPSCKKDLAAFDESTWTISSRSVRRWSALATCGRRQGCGRGLQLDVDDSATRCGSRSVSRRTSSGCSVGVRHVVRHRPEGRRRGRAQQPVCAGDPHRDGARSARVHMPASSGFAFLDLSSFFPKSDRRAFLSKVSFLRRKTNITQAPGQSI